MNLAEAKLELSRPLVFGDLKQIAAVRFIEAVEGAKEAIQNCKSKHDLADLCETCEGAGAHVCECGDEHECSDCCGDGTISGGKRIQDCECVQHFSEESVHEAIAGMHK